MLLINSFCIQDDRERMEMTIPTTQSVETFFSALKLNSSSGNGKETINSITSKGMHE